MSTVTLEKGGKLTYTKWVYDKEKEEGAYQTKDVTDIINYHLFSNCSIAEDVTLKDIFMLVEEHKDLFSIIIPDCYIEEYLIESKQSTDNKCDAKRYYMGLSWANEDDKADSKDGTGSSFSSYISVSKLSKEEDIAYSLSFIPVNQLNDLPVILDKSFIVYKGHGYDIDFKDKESYKLIELGKKEFTLSEIIYAIFYELSFYGNPKDRDGQGAELFEMAKEYEDSK